MILAYLTGIYGASSDTFIRTEIRELRRIGHTVHTFSLRRPPAVELVSEEIRDEQRQTVYLAVRGSALVGAALRFALGSPRRFGRALVLAMRTGAPGLRGRVWPFAYLLEACLLARFLHELRVEHLHVHMPEAAGNVALLAHELTSVPFSMTVHGPSIFFQAARWALGEKVARAAFTACISDYCRSQCMIFTPPELWQRLHVVRCAVESSFLLAPRTSPPTAPRFVCVGRLCREKGQPLVVEAARRLRDEGREVEILLVGDGPLRGALAEQIRELGLERQVHLLGAVDSQRVRDSIESSRALVLPSFAEGLPVVLMEALARARPVITTRVAGIPELVSDGENGWIVTPGSIESLAAAMRASLDANPADLFRMGESGALRVAQLHDPRRQAETLSELFRGAAGQKSSLTLDRAESGPGTTHW